MTKLKIALLCGGQSAEHSISLLSAANIYRQLDAARYDVRVIGIPRDGQWLGYDPNVIFPQHAVENELFREIKASDAQFAYALVPGKGSRSMVRMDTMQAETFDLVIPMLHGPMGEDGTVQGLLRLLNIPCFGADQKGSVVAMDKALSKRLLAEAGIPTSKFAIFHHEDKRPTYAEITERLGTPVFVKPANMGSSIGITKVKSAAQWDHALAEAFQYDRTILVEEMVVGRELEISILGEKELRVSLPAEVIPGDEFYTYEAKYSASAGTVFKVPANVPPHIVERAQAMARATFRALSCRVMARIDFFMTPDERLLINELNTIPGFTNMSQYPRMFEASGLPQKELIESLIRISLDEWKIDHALSVG